MPTGVYVKEIKTCDCNSVKNNIMCNCEVFEGKIDDKSYVQCLVEE